MAPPLRGLETKRDEAGRTYDSGQQGVASRDVDRQKDTLLDEISRRLQQQTDCFQFSVFSFWGWGWGWLAATLLRMADRLLVLRFGTLPVLLGTFIVCLDGTQRTRESSEGSSSRKIVSEGYNPMNQETTSRLTEKLSESPSLRAESLPSAIEIEIVSSEIGVPLSSDYRDFLFKFGAAMVGPYPIYGLRPVEVMGDDSWSVLEMMKRFREENVPEANG